MPKLEKFKIQSLTHFFIIILSIFSSSSFASNPLSEEQNNKLNAYLDTYKIKSEKIPRNQLFNFALEKLNKKDLYKLFIDKKDHTNSNPLIYDELEPGYHDAMVRAFDYLSSNLDKKLDFEEIVHLRDLAIRAVVKTKKFDLEAAIHSKLDITDKVEAIKQLSIGEIIEFDFIAIQRTGEFEYISRIPFDIGINPSFRYGITQEISTEAFYDWAKYKLIPINTRDLYLKMKSNKPLWDNAVALVKPLIKPTHQGKLEQIKELTKNSDLTSFRLKLIEECKTKEHDELGILGAIEGKIDLRLTFWDSNELFDNENLFENPCVMDVYLDEIIFGLLLKHYPNSGPKEDYLSSFEGGYVTSNLEISAEKEAEVLGLELTPELIRKTAEKKLTPYLDSFHLEMMNARSSDEQLAAISVLLRAIEIFHMFPDGNQRTVAFLLLNKLLIQNHIPPTILDSAFIFDGYLGTSEIVQEIKKGIFNFLEETNGFEEL
jgi:hypothetical protein